ncbi:MAG: TonB-dependent receptor, partial [Bacteroidota bacterium]
KNSTGKGMLTAMFGGAAEDMNYINKVSSIDSKNRSYNFTSQFSCVRTLKDNLSVFGIVRTETDDVESVNYSSHPERTIANVSAGVRKFFGYAFQTSFCTRAFFSSQKILPFVPTLSANWRLFRKSNVNIRGSWSGIARYPTLNDLYWNPGGNPDLKPETGNTRDVGISFAKPFTKNKHWLQFETGLWQSAIHDFIQWLPSDTSSWWMPQGVKDVSTKGYDASLSLTLKLGRYSLYGKCGYQHTESKVTGTENSNDNTLGKQLIYVPLHAFNGNLKLKRGNWTLDYFYQYTGKRFTTADNLRYMPSFMLNNISLGRVISLKDGSLTFQASCYNLLNTDYQVIAWQPMPGRNFNFSVKYNYNKPK